MLPGLDLHTHSSFSDGHQTFEEIFSEARKKKLKAVAVTDHHTDTGYFDVYEHTWDVEEIRTMKEKCRALSKGSETRFLLGVEAEIIDLDGCLNITPEIAAEVDFVIASLHIIPGVEMKWDKVASGNVGVDRGKVVKKCFESEIAALRNSLVDVLGHPMYVLSAGMYIKSLEEVDSNFLVELADTAAENDVAVEFNGCFFREHNQPRGYSELFSMCLQRKVPLSTGSDAHWPVNVGDLEAIHSTLTNLGAEASDLYSPVESS